MATANHSKQISKPWLSWAFWIICFFGINTLLAVVQEKFNITFFKGQLLLQGGCVKTYGSKVTIGGIKYYAIGPTQFVKANNLQ